MPRTKALQFNVGDIVQSKKYSSRIMLIVKKEEKINRIYEDPHFYTYIGLDLIDGQEYGIYTDINNKHYKILA